MRTARCSCCRTTSTGRGCNSTAPPRCSTSRRRVEPLVDYFRAVAGEHDDWDEYRQAMRDQGKSLIRVSIDRWGPIATGGFPRGWPTDTGAARRGAGASGAHLLADVVGLLWSVALDQQEPTCPPPPTAPTRWSSPAASACGTGRTTSSRASTSPSAAARSSPCSDRTVPARPRPSRSSRGSDDGPPATYACSVSTRRRVTMPGVHGSASCSNPGGTTPGGGSASCSSTRAGSTRRTAPASGRGRSRPTTCSTRSGCAITRVPASRRSRADSAAASTSRSGWSATRSCCSSTSRRPGSIRTRGASSTNSSTA